MHDERIADDVIRRGLDVVRARDLRALTRLGLKIDSVSDDMERTIRALEIAARETDPELRRVWEQTPSLHEPALANLEEQLSQYEHAVAQGDFSTDGDDIRDFCERTRELIVSFRAQRDA